MPLKFENLEVYRLSLAYIDFAAETLAAKLSAFCKVVNPKQRWVRGSLSDYVAENE